MPYAANSKKHRSHYIFNVAIPTNDKYGLIHKIGYVGHYEYKNYRITWFRTSLEVQIWATDTTTTEIFAEKISPLNYVDIDAVYSFVRTQAIRKIKSDIKLKQRGTL